MKNKLKSLYHRMTELHDQLDDLVREREDKAAERSDGWNESERGVEYLEMTEAYEAAKDTIDGAMSDLSDHLEALGVEV